MAGLTLENISKTFSNSDKAAIKKLNLSIEQEDFLVLLGPSGCGKSTLLRMISGLVTPTEGRIFIGDEDVTDLEPQDRGIGMVFQNYALYPHMNVQKNLSFSLEVAGMKRKLRNEKIQEVGEFLDIIGNLKKKPEMLSGGERQRVAIGRAMVKPCNLYLFDEPLSNLDEVLRARLRPEIQKLFYELKVPFVYVTHDQVDAMTMGTKIAVMKDGEILQIGTPQEIYEKPQNTFVGGFVGTPKMNFVESEKDGRRVILGIRPEDILITRNIPDLIELSVVLTRYEHLGNKIYLYVDWSGQELCLVAPVSVRAKVGERMCIYMNPGKCHYFDCETKERIEQE